MTWAKIDDRANEHEKQLAAGPKACWLWACGLMYCNRQTKKTGRIPKTVIHSGMLFPGLGKADAKKLVAVGLWHETDDAYEVHEYLGWNPELSAKRAEAGRAGGRASGEARREATDEANPKQVASEKGSNSEASDEARAQPRAPTRTDARGIHPTPSHSGEEDPPTPLPELPEPVPANGRRKTDRFMQSFTGLSRERPDVLALFDEWKALFGFPEAKLCVGIWNADADTLAAAIDAHGIELCRLVLKHAPNDGKVSGRTDERREKHESIAYIFENQNTFLRILRDARTAELASSSGSPSDMIRRAKERRA